MSESLVYITIGVFFVLAYAVSGLWLPVGLPIDGVEQNPWIIKLFGLDQLRHVPGWLLIVFLIFVSFFIFLSIKKRSLLVGFYKGVEKGLFSSIWLMFILALLAGLFFFTFRNNYLNPDGSAFAEKFQRDVPTLGAHVTHDEMWELYVHSRVWNYTQQLFGWSVEFTYQAISSIGGIFFTLILLVYCRFTLPPGSRLAFFLLVISGGFMQLFFGDVENYTLVNVWILLYFYLSARYLEGKASLVAVSAVLAIAMTFHLLAGFLLPSLAYLFYISLRRKEYKPMLGASLTVILIMGLTLFFFHTHGLPIQNLFSNSHAFKSLNRPAKYFSAFSLHYYWDQLNLALLLFPGCVLLLPLLLFRRISLSPRNIHLFLAGGVLILYQAFWRAQMGVYGDWNLYAHVALTLSLLVWPNLLQVQAIRRKPVILILFFAFFALHSLAWIFSNHFNFVLPT